MLPETHPKVIRMFITLNPIRINVFHLFQVLL